MTTADGSVLGTTKIVDNGPSSVRWDLVFMGDGYRSSQMAQYEADVQRFVDHMFRTPPFDEMRRTINVHRVNVTSTESGADDPRDCEEGTGATARTYFDASFCNDGLRRLLKVNAATALATLDDQVPQWNAVLVVVNSTVHGGFGGTVGTSSLAPGAEDIVLHELGHSAFGLADEYETYRGCDSGETDRNNHPAGEPAEGNVTVNTDPATLKWRRFVADPTDVPTTRNADCTECDPQASPFPAGTVGLFEGANHYHCGAFRPEFDCKMRISSKPFCAICRERIRRVLAPHLRGSILLDQGVYTVQQKSSGRFMDAYQSEAGNFAAVTRTAQNDDTQRWLLRPVGEVYTVQQKSSGRFVDAYEDSSHDFSVVTRTAKNNDAQRWVFMPVGSSEAYTIQQLSSGRFMDAHEVPDFDFRLVTRTAQNNDTQRWMVVHLGGDTYTIQQVSNGRFVDAHEVSSQDFRLVTRTAQNNDTQRWILTPVGRVFNIEQRSNRRLVDAFEVSSEDFAVVTRTPQADLSQSWVFLPSGTDTYTIRQLSSRRFVDAYGDSGHDFAVVTRTAKNSDVQRWVIKPL